MGTTPAPAPEPQASISPVGRLFGALFSPAKTFEDIVRKPTWVLPTVVLIVLSMVAIVPFAQRVDWRDYISQKIEKTPQAANLSADQKAQRIEMGAKITPIILYATGLVGPPVGLLLISLVMWGAYSLFAGVSPGFKTSLAIAAYASMTAWIKTPLFLLIVFLKPPGTIDVENPIATNLASFLSPDIAKWLYALCKQIDVFTIWTLVLLAIGFAASNRRKLTTGKSMAIAFGVWAVFLLIVAGFTFVFS